MVIPYYSEMRKHTKLALDEVKRKPEVIHFIKERLKEKFLPLEKREDKEMNDYFEKIVRILLNDIKFQIPE